MRDGHRLVVAANRLPMSRAHDGSWTPSPGGLVSAVGPLIEETGGVCWLGWDGQNSAPHSPPPKHPAEIEMIALSNSDLTGYYRGLSNQGLWPLYHDRIEEPIWRSEWWDRYVEVNSRYAKRIANVLAADGIAWIHDYHLQLVPGMLRILRPEARIGFFLHTPFPAPELIAQFPWWRELIGGLLGSDLVGFQTPLWADNFRRAGWWSGVARAKGDSLRAHRRRVRVGAFPVAADVTRLVSLASSPRAESRAAALRARWGRPIQVLLGVDRLDYTKGIVSRLRAFELLLQRLPAIRSAVKMVQVAVPTRTGIPAYERHRRQVEELVAGINRRFAGPGGDVVIYSVGSLPPEELVAHYLAADVMCVTPLRDGMNLVAKEFVASRVDNGGVLLLSELAGAARELKEALVVNPHDIEGMTQQMAAALRMPADKARDRMIALRETVCSRDAVAWAADFLRVLQEETRLTPVDLTEVTETSALAADVEDKATA